MEAVEPRSLLTDVVVKVIPNEGVQEMFQQYKQLMKKHKTELTDFDIFFAGWVLSNPILREQFKQVREKEIKYNPRIDETVWK